jgi:hypothetical protein
MKAKYFLNNEMEIGKELVSLHNITKEKTKIVREVIEKLQPRYRMNSIAIKKFLEIKNKALEPISAEESLDIIGYEFKRTPLIYKKAFQEGDKR